MPLIPYQMIVPDRKNKKEKLLGRLKPCQPSRSRICWTLIEEEMDARRRNVKLSTAVLFQDLTCNPNAVMFIKASAFTIMDGDTFHFIGGRAEEWEELLTYVMKFIHDKDPWSARQILKAHQNLFLLVFQLPENTHGVLRPINKQMVGDMMKLFPIRGSNPVYSTSFSPNAYTRLLGRNHVLVQS